MIDINFNKDPYPNAEMLPYERQSLYYWIVNIIKPKVIIETGTGIGGSTYFMGKALQKIGFGEIYTCDPERKPPNEFFNEFNNVKFYQKTSSFMINDIIKNKIDIDYIFFDGPDDPTIAFDDLMVLEPYLKSGCYFSMHDWEITKRGYDGATSTKAALIRPYLENSSKWKLIQKLSGIEKNSNSNKELYDSVGLCLYKFEI